MIRLFGVVLGLAAAVLCSTPAQGQRALYGQAAGANLQFPNTSHVYGGIFGGYATKPVGPIALGFDVRGGMMKRGSSQGLYNDQALDIGLLGVRVAGTPGAIPMLHSLMPYAEALIGFGYWRGGVSTSRQDANHSLMQAVVGFDYAIVPHLQWRIAEFTYGRAGAMPGHIHPETLSTGIVLQLP